MIKGKNIILKPVDEGSFTAIHQFITSREASESLGEPLPLTELSLKEWIRAHSDKQSHLFFSIENSSSSSYLGIIFLRDIDFINGKARMCIIGNITPGNSAFFADAVSLILAYAFNDLRLHKIYAEIPESSSLLNTAMENGGLVRECIFKEEFFHNNFYGNIIRLTAIAPSSSSISQSAEKKAGGIDFQWFQSQKKI